jgi:phosphatidate cytidylyltransferase
VVRLVSGVLLAAGFLALVWFGNATVLLGVAIVVGVLALHEYAELMRQLGAVLPRLATGVALVATIVAVSFSRLPLEAVIGLGVVLIAAAAMVTASRTALPRAGVTDMPATAAVPAAAAGFAPAVLGAAAGGFALAYLALPLGALVGVHISGGRGAVVLLVATVALSDSAQYYTGRAFGRHPLARRLSPKKTIEGALGGFVIAPVFLYFAGPYFVPAATPLTIAPLGLVLVACGIAGDLFESMIKRAADIKDSSALIPGHGGVLDRIDALLFATPPFYVFLRWVYSG